MNPIHQPAAPPGDNAYTTDTQRLLAFQAAMKHIDHTGADGVTLASGADHPPRWAQVEMALHHALELHQMKVFYQPKVVPSSGNINGVEALLRWDHPQLGKISPTEFIPAAERTGLIHALGAWVLREACLQGRQWHEQGWPNLTVAVNVSAAQLAVPGFSNQVARLLDRCGFPAAMLELELTESMLLQPRLASVLQELSALGLKLSLDDFGTGFSSLSYLKHFPIDRIKIDRSFVRDLDLATQGERMPVATAIIGLAHCLGLDVVAEGVETETELAYLSRHRCDVVQGYYFSRPLAADDLASWLRADTSIRSQPLHQVHVHHRD